MRIITNNSHTNNSGWAMLIHLSWRSQAVCVEKLMHKLHFFTAEFPVLVWDLEQPSDRPLVCHEFQFLVLRFRSFMICYDSGVFFVRSVRYFWLSLIIWYSKIGWLIIFPIRSMGKSWVNCRSWGMSSIHFHRDLYTSSGAYCTSWFILLSTWVITCYNRCYKWAK